MRELKMTKPVQLQDTTYTDKQKSSEDTLQDTAKTNKYFYQTLQNDTTAQTPADTTQQPVTPAAEETEIKSSVGKNGVNDPADVSLVESKLKSIGLYNDSGDLVAAIMEFQKYVLKRTSPDGRIDAGGPTWNKLKVTDAGAFETMKQDYEKEQEQKKKTEVKPNAGEQKKEQDALKLAQLKSKADKEARELIEKYTSYGNLNEESLGKELAHMTLSKPYTVYRVLDFLGSTDRDDVAYEIVKNMYAKELLAANKALLKRLYNELDAGWTSGGEYKQMELLKMVLGMENSKKENTQNEKDLNRGSFDLDKAIATLNENALSQSSGYCARYVRFALEAGGINTAGRPGSAKDYDSYLLGKGFKIVNSSGYTPVKGDIAVFESFTGAKKHHPHGHIQMYNGSQWISDFKQHDFWAGPDYRNYKPSYTILRW